MEVKNKTTNSTKKWGSRVEVWAELGDSRKLVGYVDVPHRSGINYCKWSNSMENEQEEMTIAERFYQGLKEWAAIVIMGGILGYILWYGATNPTYY